MVIIVGYLNAPSPFTKDGWFKTGDSVLVDGDYIKILGRESEIINVGGEKVYSMEVENVIQEFDNVAEVTVFGKKNAITGNTVCAKIRLLKKQDHKQFSISLKKYCRDKLQNFKVPIKIEIDDQKQHGKRFKKSRPEIEIISRRHASNQQAARLPGTPTENRTPRGYC